MALTHRRLAVRFSFDDENQVIVALRVLPRGRAYDR
jgi:hypothetical protein